MEYRLSERLEQLVDRHRWLVGDPIPKNAHRWATKAAMARNFRAHHDPTAQTVGAEVDQLVGFASRLTVLLEACLLSEAGFEPNSISDMIRRASPSYRLLRLNPKL